MKAHAILLILATLASAARADVVSRFDTPTKDGWNTTADVLVTDLSVLATGTTDWVQDTLHPERSHISASEISTGKFPGLELFVIVAPDAYLHDQSAYYGGSVRYTLGDAADGDAYPNLLLRGKNGLSLFYTTPAPVLGGTDYAIPLTETGWKTLANVQPTQAQFQSVLADLDVS